MDCWEKLTYKKNIVNGCDGLWVGDSINYDGNVVPCCNDYFSSVKYGNLKEKRLLDICFSKEMRNEERVKKRKIFSWYL